MHHVLFITNVSTAIFLGKGRIIHSGLCQYMKIILLKVVMAHRFAFRPRHTAGFLQMKRKKSSIRYARFKVLKVLNSVSPDPMFQYSVK